MRAVHGRHPVGCGYGSGNHRGDAFVPQIGAENRAIDHDEEGSMELKKREGYF